MKPLFRLLPGFAAALLLAHGAGRAQTQSGSSALRMPADLKEFDSCVGPQVGDVQKKEKQADFWMVWADREGVQVYSDQTLQTVKAGVTVGFLEPFYVTEVRADKKAMSLISSKSKPFEPTIVVDRTVGWVKTEHLLLRSASARTSDLIPKRAFIINDFKEFQSASKDAVAQKEVPVRKSPSTAGTKDGTWGGTNIFSYVYKYDQCGGHDWFLVGQKTSIKTNRSASEVIIGWVPRSRAVEWDTREAYEPDPRRTTPANIYTKGATDPKREVLFTDALSKEKWAADRWRYVLLSNTPSAAKEVQIGFVGDLKIIGSGAGPGKDALRTADPALQAKIQQSYDIITNINLIFVVDGTASMGPYLKKVADAVERMVESVSKDIDTERVKLSYGAVAYRDLSDTKANQLEIRKLSKTPAALVSFLRGLKDPPANGPDKDYEEALFEGIQVALRDVAQPKQRNIIIVLGDAGNQDTKGPLDTTAFTRRLNDKFLNMYALHIQRPPRDPNEKAAIDKFEKDVTQVFTVLTRIKDSATANASEILPGAPEYKSLVLDRTKPNLEDLDGAALKIGLEVRKQALMGQMMAAQFSVCMDKGFEECLADAKRKQPPPIDDGTPSTYLVTAAMLEIIVGNMGADRKLVEDAIAKKVQLFQPGWVATADMRPMYLVQQFDLARGMTTLQEFAEAGNVDGAHLVEFFKSMVETLTGHKPENRSNPGEYIRMNGGLRFKGLSSFLDKSYDELASASPAELRKFVEAAKVAEDKLRALYENDSIWFKNYGDKYAWIAGQDLP